MWKIRNMKTNEYVTVFGVVQVYRDEESAKYSAAHHSKQTGQPHYAIMPSKKK